MSRQKRNVLGHQDSVEGGRLLHSCYVAESDPRALRYTARVFPKLLRDAPPNAAPSGPTAAGEGMGLQRLRRGWLPSRQCYTLTQTTSQQRRKKKLKHEGIWS